jgi:D-aminopeptidase
MKQLACLLLLLILGGAFSPLPGQRPRLREFGIKTGVLPPGPLNAITDVTGVRVGHVTLIEGDSVRTGVTAILPHGDNPYQFKVPAAIYVANGHGKLTGISQVRELGTIETPIILTNTLSVPTAADAVLDYILNLPGNEKVVTVNPVVGETNDSGINDIRGRHVRKEHVLEAIRGAKEGPVEEGAVGAGTGTSCYYWKGGIGTASRRLPEELGGYTVGVLVQTNHGGVLTIKGSQIGVELGRFSYQRYLEGDTVGSCMIVVATDAPLDSRNLERLAKRATLGIPRTGGYFSNASGDYAIAFSAAPGVRIPHISRGATRTAELVRNERMSPIFLAAAEASEEAILNSIFKAETVKGRDGRVLEALPLDKVEKILKRMGIK